MQHRRRRFWGSPRRSRRGSPVRMQRGAGQAPSQPVDNRTISSYSTAVRRKTGSLVPLEISILEAALSLRRQGSPEVHGFLFAKTIRDREQARRLTAYGTLYKALERLERLGYLESRWEDPLVAASAGRPRRRLYRITLVGERAHALAETATASSTSRSATPEVAM